ncbi:MAG: murein L,D-transpeptidase [Xanthobacteraceae bacterium]
MTRRELLGRMAGGAAGCALGHAALAAEDPLLQALIRQGQQSEFGQGFDSTSRTILLPKASLPTLSPATAQATEQAVARYEAIVTRGGWPTVPVIERLRIGHRHASVMALRKRLLASGDLDTASGTSDIFDSYVEAAVRRFQARHGITIDGIVREPTYKALNVSAEQRLAQLRVNLPRLRALSGHLAPRFVTVNIPAAQVEAIEHGVCVSRHIGVVGKPDRPSPELNSRIIEINFNPYWTVPVSIVRRDLIPKMQSEPDYLTKNRIRIFDRKNRELQPTDVNWETNEAVHYMFKQDPGELNSLGAIKINFPNQHQVYMHDTPLKNLFGEEFRFHSSGCVRIQNVRELVYWILSETPAWPRVEVDRVIKDAERKDAKLAKPVPLHWVYVTGWATADGVLQFRDDIYGRDGLGGPVAATSPG